MLIGARLGMSGGGAQIEYQGNPIVNLSGLYGTSSTSWTTVDDRYTFTRFNTTMPELVWSNGALDLNQGQTGIFADTLAVDKTSTELTIEIAFRDFVSKSVDCGFAFALDNGYSINSSMYQHCKGLRNAGNTIYASYQGGAAQDYWQSSTPSLIGLHTLALTNPKNTEYKNKRALFVLDGVLHGSANNGTTGGYSNEKIPAKFAIGKTAVSGTGWHNAPNMKICAVRFHYGILTAEQLAANYELDCRLYG